MPNIKQRIESQIKSDSNGIGVTSIRALSSPPEGYAPAPVSCPIWGMTGEYKRSISHISWLSSSFGGMKMELFGGCHCSPASFLVKE
jgi:hypothetical protein